MIYYNENNKYKCEVLRNLIDNGMTSISDELSDCNWVMYPDGKYRLTKPGIQLLDDGDTNRMVKIHAIGDAIVPQVASKFISCVMEVLKDDI